MSLQRLPPLRSLRAFEAAARLSSFKAAAAELSVTPGAVSQQIRALEEDLGVKLFERTVRAVSLTEAGRRLQPALTAAFLQMRDAIDSVRPGPQTPLRVGSSGAVISKWLLPRLRRFAERYPDLSVTIMADSGRSGVDADAPDVAIRFIRSPGPGLFAQKIGDEHLLPLASPHLIDRLALRAPVDMIRAPLLHGAAPEIPGDLPDWPHWFGRVGLNPAQARRGVRFDRHAAHHAIDAAANGDGVVLGRRFLADGDLRAGRLASPFGPMLRAHVSYFVLCDAGEEARPEIAAFINWVCEEIGPVDDSAALGVIPG